MPERLRSPPTPECYKWERYYTVAEAARIVTFVSESTLRRWVVNGWTSFGLSLDVERRKGPLLIPELKTLVLKEFLVDHPLPKPGASASVRKEFRQAVKDFGFHWISPRSVYSCARSPCPSPN